MSGSQILHRCHRSDESELQGEFSNEATSIYAIRERQSRRADSVSITM